MRSSANRPSPVCLSVWSASRVNPSTASPRLGSAYSSIVWVWTSAPTLTWWRRAPVGRLIVYCTVPPGAVMVRCRTEEGTDSRYAVRRTKPVNASVWSGATATSPTTPPASRRVQMNSLNVSASGLAWRRSCASQVRFSPSAFWL